MRIWKSRRFFLSCKKYGVFNFLTEPNMSIFKKIGHFFSNLDKVHVRAAFVDVEHRVEALLKHLEHHKPKDAEDSASEEK